MALEREIRFLRDNGFIRKEGKKNNGCNTYENIQLCGNCVSFVRGDKWKGERINLNELYAFYTSGVSLTTTNAKRFISGRVQSPSVAILDALNNSKAVVNDNCVNIEESVEDSIHCFEPVVDEDSRILILGSMPGVESLRRGEYYAKNGNAMWRIMADLFNDGKAFSNYDEKLKCMHDNHIAMWDTLKSCVREGSLDADIKNGEPNDIIGFLNDHPGIVRVIANGGKAASNMPKGVDFLRAGSTSGANAVKYEKKLDEWRKLLDLGKA